MCNGCNGVTILFLFLTLFCYGGKPTRVTGQNGGKCSRWVVTATHSNAAVAFAFSCCLLQPFSHLLSPSPTLPSPSPTFLSFSNVLRSGRLRLPALNFLLQLHPGRVRGARCLLRRDAAALCLREFDRQHRPGLVLVTSCYKQPSPRAVTTVTREA
jgi:hypothetical protein